MTKSTAAKKPAPKKTAAKKKSAKSALSATELTKLTIAEARDGLRSGAFSSREITQACLSAIDAADRLNAVVHKTPERALEMADAADARIAAGDAPDLCGVPLGIKDLFCTEGAPSQAASNILGGFKPPYESTVTRQLWERGAVMLGKLNMDDSPWAPRTRPPATGLS